MVEKRCGSSLVAHQTTEAVVPGSYPVSLTVENSADRQSHCVVYTVKSLGREGNLKRKKSQEPVSSDKNLPPPPRQPKRGGKESSMSQSLDLTMGTMRPIEEKPSASKTKSSLPYLPTYAVHTVLRNCALFSIK